MNGHVDLLALRTAAMHRAITRAETAEAELAALRAQVESAEKFARKLADLAPDDDWGNSVTDTVLADAGRQFLRALLAANEAPSSPADATGDDTAPTHTPDSHNEPQNGAIRAVSRVVALHVEAYPGAGWCAGCHGGGQADQYPCDTLRAVQGGDTHV
jgi:hypothetical protein